MSTEIDDLERTMGFVSMDPRKLSAEVKRKRGINQPFSEDTKRQIQAMHAANRRQGPSLPQFKCLRDD